MPNDSGRGKKPAAQPQKQSSQVLYFYPRDRMMLYVVNGKEVERAEAWGGVSPDKGARDDVMAPQKTTAGKYVIGSVKAYRTKTWSYSRIAWGTRLMSSDGKNVLYETGSQSNKWARLDDLIPGISVASVTLMYFELYGKNEFPATWVFNDFGPVAVRYYVDLNHDRRQNKNEPMMGEMIHTTPSDEASTAKGEPFSLQTSHGCIHIRPVDRDRLMRAGAFAIGNDLIVYDYETPLPAAPQ